MELKKSPKASLEDKRLIFAETGLILALLAVYAGFETSTRAQATASLINTTKVLNDTDIIPITLDTPPPAPETPSLPQLTDEIEIVEDDVAVDLDFQNLDDTDFPVNIQDYIHQEVVEEEVEEDTIFVGVVQEKPTFNGGDANEFSKWVNARLVYPEIAKENGVEGRVTLQFTITKDGRLQDVKVLSSPDETLSREAVRVVSGSPKWTPGRQRDRAVNVTYTFPVIYRLR